jgi:2-oxoglutarate ferredoxin oxidoreductase subunit gamma
MEKYGMVFTGSGGQGVITAAIILAEAAVLHEGLIAVQSQIYGAEARGGATRTDIIISDEDIDYPKVIQPSILVCLTQLAYTTYSQIIRPGGLLITDTRYVKTHHKVDARQREFPMYQAVMDDIGRPIVFNICMLGVVIGLTDVIKPDSIMKVLETRLPKHSLALNRKAMELGVQMGAEKKS